MHQNHSRIIRHTIRPLFTAYRPEHLPQHTVFAIQHHTDTAAHGAVTPYMRVFQVAALIHAVQARQENPCKRTELARRESALHWT
ncbi:hypothetical protein D7Y51_11820 [Stenotrophomonas maltophilia]|nr:hypothetical protein [Stenotrophomonas maltophilia]HEP1207128.1 hypothetical protein [Stenotrophomonas maltophilia]